MSADMSNASNYQKVCEAVDVQGLMDFVTFESYIVNWDCMLHNNNWMIWRADETDASNPYADGKWRFLLFDTEYSSGYDGQCSVRRNYFQDMDRSGKNTSLGSLFFKLMQNSEFKQQFRKRYQAIVADNFDAQKVSAKIESSLLLQRLQQLTPSADSASVQVSTAMSRSCAISTTSEANMRCII